MYLSFGSFFDFKTHAIIQTLNITYPTLSLKIITIPYNITNFNDCCFVMIAIRGFERYHFCVNTNIATPLPNHGFPYTLFT